MTAVVIIDMSIAYWILTVGLVLGGGVFFIILMILGEKLIVRIQAKKEANRKTIEDLNQVSTINISTDQGG